MEREYLSSYRTRNGKGISYFIEDGRLRITFYELTKPHQEQVIREWIYQSGTPKKRANHVFEAFLDGVRLYDDIACVYPLKHWQLDAFKPLDPYAPKNTP